MAIIYHEDFAAGNSLFGDTYEYNRTVEGIDPLYPYIRGAEGVYINGDGFLDHSPAYTGEFQTYQQAGIWIKGPGALNGGGSGGWGGAGFWNGTVGWVEALYHPTTLSITEMSEEFVTAPLIQICDPFGFSLLAVYVNLDDAIMEVDQQNSGSHDTEIFVPGAPMPVAGEPYLVRLQWRCGTWDDGLAEALPDGNLSVYINGTLIYEATEISIYLTPLTVPENMLDGAMFGYFGLLGPLEYFTINDEAYVIPEVLQFRSGGTEYPLFFSNIQFKEIP